MDRRQHLLHVTLIVASLSVASCGSSETAKIPPGVVAIDARPLAVHEGSAADRDFEVSTRATGRIASADGLDVELREPWRPSPHGEELDRIPDEIWRLVVRAPYGVTGRRRIDVVLENGAGSTHAFVDVDVAEAAWKPNVTWENGPEAREHGAVIRDDANKRVILIGGSGYKPYGTPLGDVWAWSLTEQKWSKPEVEGDVPSPAGSRRVAMDGANAYLFGGYGEGSASNDELIRVELGNPLKFKKLTHTGGIPARSLHAFAKAKDGFVVFGGASTRPWNDTWSLTIAGDVGTFTKLAPPTMPSARYGFFYGADAERLIVWSGAQSFSTLKAAEDTWAFDFATREWSKVAAGDPSPPKGRRNGCFVYDPELKRLFVFGGTADAMTSEPGFFVLDARAGREAWTKLERAGEPELRSSGFGFFDPTTRTATCGFGNTTTDVYADWTSFGP